MRQGSGRKIGMRLLTKGIAFLATPLAMLALGLWIRVVGSGVVKSESRAVHGFDEVALAGSGTLTITQTGEESLTISADDNILPLLTSEVTGHRLVLGTKPNTSYETRNRIVYQLAVRDLKWLFISGSGDATAASIKTPTMSIGIS